VRSLSEPVDPVEVVNFFNVHRPRRSPAGQAIARAVEIDGSHVRCVQLADLIALELETGARRDQPMWSRCCARAGHDIIEVLIEEAKHPR
jgi:hypothetical protein